MRTMGSKQAFCSLVLLVLLSLQHGATIASALRSKGFVGTSGTHFVLNGRPFYSNGFNAYWLMYMASDPAERAKVSSAFQQASTYGMNVVRTWAFSDGGYRPLQTSPGSYNEDMFKGLDFVISEARKHGVYLILSFVNNYADFGGRKQYVQWGRDKGQYLNSDDDFYRNDVVKGFYKNHIKAVLTRINTVTGVAYKDDPTIFAWELMNEPRCDSDLSGKTLQNWIGEMAAHVKSVDGNHMVEIGMEGFYGESMPDRKQYNPGNYEIGTDFISNNQLPQIDFATIHAYPDQWITGADEKAQTAFLQRWIESHTKDAGSILKKPVMVAEFGKSSKMSGYTVGERDAMFWAVYNAIYASAKSGGPCTGGLFWQLLVQGMDNFRDGYEIVFPECPTTAAIIYRQSRRIAALNNINSNATATRTPAAAADTTKSDEEKPN